MWDYWWGLSESQIDLLLVDQPLINYKKDKKKKGKGKSGKFDNPAPSKLKVAEAEMKWKQKYADGSKPKLDLNFSDFNIGSTSK